MNDLKEKQKRKKKTPASFYREQKKKKSFLSRSRIFIYERLASKRWGKGRYVYVYIYIHYLTLFSNYLKNPVFFKTSIEIIIFYARIKI